MGGGGYQNLAFKHTLHNKRMLFAIIPISTYVLKDPSLRYHENDTGYIIHSPLLSLSSSEQERICSTVPLTC